MLFVCKHLSVTSLFFFFNLNVCSCYVDIVFSSVVCSPAVGNKLQTDTTVNYSQRYSSCGYISRIIKPVQ